MAILTADGTRSARALSTRTWIRVWLAVMIAGLVVSGITAFPLPPEVAFITAVIRESPLAAASPDLLMWLSRVDGGLTAVTQRWPFLLYGTDWLAFAHLVIAAAFIGPWRDPVRNVWVIRWGMMACVGVIPLAVIAGSVRGVPFWWQCIDMSFGVVGTVPLIIVLRLIRRLDPSA